MTTGHDRMILDVGLTGDQLRASLSVSSEALAPMQTWATRTVDLATVRGLCDAISALLGRATRWGDMDQGSMALLRQRGELLFDELLPSEVKRELREHLDAPGAQAEIALVLDERLVFVPWELMFTGAVFLGLAGAVGRVVRTERAVLGRARPTTPAPWRMLVLCDPRGDLIGSYYEGVTLRDELDVERARLAIDLRTSDASVADVKLLLRDYDVVHYAGHAELHPDAPERSGWLLADGVLSPTAIVALAGGRPFPRIVFSNACRSGLVDHPSGARPGADDGTTAFGSSFGLANAFMLAGVHHYIGALWDIPDEPASHFAVEVYAGLMNGASLGAAMLRGRRALIDRYGDDTVLWASYVLYGDPGVACFAQRATDPTGPDPQLRSAEAAPGEMTLVEPLTIGAPDAAETRPGWRPRRNLRRRWPSEVGVEGASGTPARTGWLERPGRLAALVIAVATLLAAGALALAMRDPTPSGGAVLVDGPFVAERGAERIPLPPEPGAAHAPAEAERAEVAPPVTPAVTTELVVVAQRPDDHGEFHSEQLGADATLHSWDNFQLRFRVAASGWVAVYHVESQGEIARVHSAEGDHHPVNGATWQHLPDRQTWFYLDDRQGIERFILAYAADEPSADPAFDAAVAEISRGLVETRAARAAAAKPDEALNLRGLGGTRPGPRAPAEPGSEEALLARLAALLDARYDEVRMVAFRHR